MKTAKEMLNEIDEFFEKASIQETANLWVVLSALRGPDNSSCELKEATTEVIRGRAFPKGRTGELSTLVNISNDSVGSTDIRNEHHQRENHFTSHAFDAFEILRLDWKRNNNPVPEVKQ